MLLVYLCGPIIGQTYQEARFGWRQSVANQLDECRFDGADIKCLSPMRQEGHLEVIGDKPLTDANVEMHADAWSHNRTLFRKDVLDIKRCDLLLANFIGADTVSKGSICEIGMAFALGKPIVVVLDKGNVHDHPFVTEPADIVAGDLNEGVYAVKALLTPGI